MKIHNLAIIFLIIIIPIISIFSFYLNLEMTTINLQTEYDGKLIEATKEAVEAFEINTVEWSDEYSTLANSKRREIMASINVFVESLSNKLGIGGSNKESILTYIPAIVYIMYDGYYIYAPTYVPQTITNDNGVQLFYYEKGTNNTKITASATQNINGKIYAGEPMYVGKELTGIYNNSTINFTTDISKAEKTYKHVLKTFVPYTCTYGDYTINYTLDNYVRIYAEDELREGTVIENFGSINKIEVYKNNISNIKLNGNIIKEEQLTENIYVRDDINQSAQLKTYTYIYNSNNDKRYYDSSVDRFFILNDKNVKIFLTEAKVGQMSAEYKKLLVCTDEASGEYLELYQIINNRTDTNWYYINENGEYVKYSNTIIGMDNALRNKDFSAINYYVEANNFNKWLKSKNIDANSILEGKRETIIENINNNLNLSISNYSANSSVDCKIVQLTDEDWNQALSNISMISFFQGIKIGLKTYNNYTVVTSNENNEYITEDSLYYVDDINELYHRKLCSKGNTLKNEAYRNTEFKVQTYTENGVTKYYYKHTNSSYENYYGCFDCIVNRNNYIVGENQNYETSFYTSIAREKYIQIQKTKLIDNKNTVE